MEFVRLVTVLGEIADEIDLPPHFVDQGRFDQGSFECPPAFQRRVDEFWRKCNPAIERQRKISCAALFLNEALHHPDGELPAWMEFDDRKRFAVRAEAIGHEAIEILTNETAHGGSLLEACAAHVRDASIGYRSDALDLDFADKWLGTAKAARQRLREGNIGFDAIEIRGFLASNDIKEFVKAEPNPRQARVLVTDEMKTEMRKMRREGKTDAAIALHFERTRTWVSKHIGTKTANKARANDPRQGRSGPFRG